MIIIHFSCNGCDCTAGQVELILDKPFVICSQCGEYEEIVDSDITGQ